MFKLYSPNSDTELSSLNFFSTAGFNIKVIHFGKYVPFFLTTLISKYIIKKNSCRSKNNGTYTILLVNIIKTPKIIS